MYSTAVSDVDDKLMDFCCFYHLACHFLDDNYIRAVFLVCTYPPFRDFSYTSEKLVPILCHRGQKFDVLYELSTYQSRITVKYD